MTTIWYFTKEVKPAFFLDGQYVFSPDGAYSYFIRDGWWFTPDSQPAYFLDGKWAYTKNGIPTYYTA